MDALQSIYSESHGAAVAEDETAPVSEPGLSKALPSENGPTSTLSGADATGDDETTGRRRRRSRWDPPTSESTDGTGGKKRKSRWADDEPKPALQLPDFLKDLTGGIELDPEIQALNSRLLEIHRKMQSSTQFGTPLDDRPEGARSPSPEPIYDNMGVRVNTREFRAREKLNRERQEIISQIIKKNPAFKPPADYRPPKLHKKLYIPMKEYPGYNFIGLIIGPRGNTQKRMERETGAKIVIRGKGSIKEGRLQQKRDLKSDPADNEDLHVLVEADTQDSLDAAAGMVEKLLQPVDEVLNEHKRQQLRELAALNGTIRDEEFCRLCGEAGHRQFACPSRLTTFKSDVLCKICGDGGHPTIDCPVKSTTGKKMDDEYKNFLEELGGTLPESSTKSSLPTLGLPSSSGTSNLPWANGTNHHTHPQSQTLDSNDGSDSASDPVLPGAVPSSALIGPREDETTERRPRRSRWEPLPTDGSTDDDTGVWMRKSRWEPFSSDSTSGSAGDATGVRKRKSRWEPLPVTQFDTPLDYAQLDTHLYYTQFDPPLDYTPLDYTQLDAPVYSSPVYSSDEEWMRRRSYPEPVYDVQEIWEQHLADCRLPKLPEKLPTPMKHQKKLHIPMREYPGYNFIGSIIGARKKMEAETGAKIDVRGKCSMLQQKGNKEEDDLHVLIGAQAQESLDAAASMVEKLLQPADEVLHEHKRERLTELAALNGRIRDEVLRQREEQLLRLREVEAIRAAETIRAAEFRIDFRHRRPRKWTSLSVLI